METGQGLCDPRRERDACGVGLLADLSANRTHDLVMKALGVLRRLAHRGATGSEPGTGDGAGILLQLPDRFFRGACGFELPSRGRYGVGMFFLPRDDGAVEAHLERVARGEKMRVLGWRTVPADNTGLGETALRAEPLIRQLFVAPEGEFPGEAAWERRLYVLRRCMERAAGEEVHITSLSHRTVCYKGMLRGDQVESYYPDLSDPAFESALALVHARFSTNTFPSWSRAQPFRTLCHNGEINTLRGNVNAMRAREGMLRSDLLGDDLGKVLPVIDPAGSDSAMLDNTLELLSLTGRSLPHAVMMAIPEPWSGDPDMGDPKRAFYEYHACLMEPWDGPALVAFTDGVRAGAVLDRNGLRPARWCVTRDGLLVMASEAGVLDLPPGAMVRKDRLRPGRMLLADLEEGRIIDDAELKEAIASRRPYRAWLRENLVPLEDLPAGEPAVRMKSGALEPLLRAFGYTSEDLRLILEPMARDGIEPVGSMGADTPLAVLSKRPQLLYDYFTQIFAQVTNPPVDAIRVSIVMSMETTIGSERNLLEPGPNSCRRIRLAGPMLDRAAFARLSRLDGSSGFRSRTLSTLTTPGADLSRALGELCAGADVALAEGCDVLILSDRGVGRDRAALPALLAVSAVHQHLVRRGTRTRCGLVVESGEPREIHHFALLLGYGAEAIHPWLALEKVAALPDLPRGRAGVGYLAAATKGIIKVMSKMGISTLQGYRGAQIFEAVGLDRGLVEEHFTGTASRVGGDGLGAVAADTFKRHAEAFGAAPDPLLDPGGQYRYRDGGERHLFDAEAIHLLQRSCRHDDYRSFKAFTQKVERCSRGCTLRGLMRLLPAEQPVPLEEVEPVESIVKRFRTGAMSYGSISPEAHEALAVAMNRIGGKSNTGEGGEDPARYVPDPNGDSRNSAVKQVASGRFGVNSLYLVHADELQIKMAQGAKPGEGGQLPGRKVYPWIAKVRHATPGVGLISPPPHHDIYSIEDLAGLIHDLKCANPRARVSVKLVAAAGVGTIAAGVVKGLADSVLISGHDGGTGASPLSSIRHAGAPWELGLAETQQVLIANRLRGRVALEVDGQLKTGRDVVIGALLGAEEFGFATAPLVVLGCVMMRVCHLNTCPMGVATQDPNLRRRFAGDPAHVVTFMRFVAQEVRELMAYLGFRTFDEMVGRCDRIAPRGDAELDLSEILLPPPPGVPRRRETEQDHGLERTLDRTTLLDLCRPALTRGEKVRAEVAVRNDQRAVGTLLGSEITLRCGAEGLPPNTIRLRFRGSAGQSFAAFLPRGVTLDLEGDVNDYAGKGLSGGRVILRPPAEIPAESVIAGNVALYGATSGSAYFAGLAGERFAVRNSGARAVVEGVGDHGCEYMTGGRVVVLGPVGRNFAAGMSGGIAYVLDESGGARANVNPSMVGVLPLSDPAEIEEVRRLVRRHARFTGSRRAWRVLALWEQMVPAFLRILPHDYARALEARVKVESMGLSGEEAEMKAFEINASDPARAGGN